MDDLRKHLIIILHLFLTVLLFAQLENIRFEHLTVEDGLSDNKVQSIIQDSRGFMWFGTMNGLNKYDGYKFTIYKNDPMDSLSLAENFITALYEDHLGVLWIGTRGGGLCKYDRNRDAFIRYSYIEQNPNSLCGDQITSILETDQHILWIGCGNGLNRYNRKSDNFVRYYPDENKSQLNRNVNFIGAIAQDSSNQLWIVTWNEGLFKFDKENNRFFRYEEHPKYYKIFINQFSDQLIASRRKGKDYLWFASHTNGLYRIEPETSEIRHYQHQPDKPTSISDNRINAIYQGGKESKELWIATEFGLNRFDIQTEEFNYYHHQQENQWSIGDNSVSSVFKDRSGLMWVGTLKGVDKFDPKTSNFNTILQLGSTPDYLFDNTVTAIHEFNEGSNRTILLGTTENGLIAFNRTSRRFIKYQHDPKNINSLSDNFITGIIESGSGRRKVFWVSTSNGLNKIDLKAKRINRYYIPNNDPVHNMMYSLCEDSDGIIWIGTQSSYLYNFDPETEQFTRYNSHQGPIFTLHLDLEGIMWIGTESGLYKFNSITKEETHYHHDTGDMKSISEDKIWYIFEGRNKAIWTGTSGGLNKFDRSTEIFTSFGERDGLPNNVVRAIMEDGHGNLWLSTNRGISRFNLESKAFRNFHTIDGLSGDEFFRSAAYINHGGEMFFGGRDGLTYFHPDSIKDNNRIPSIIITDFQIFNQSIKPMENAPLKEQVSEVNEITLSYDQSIFSFEFAALEYHKPEKIKYAYMMENVDPDWVFTDASRRFVTYTQLDAGDYVFRVKASNSDGIWNEQDTSVKITILPPWWQTWWSYSIYIALILGTLYGLRRYELSRQRLKYNLELEQVEAEKLTELDKMKSRFFANISHEFRTPLTLIKGPIERWLPEIEQPEMRRDFEMTERNTERLLQLVNQLQDISRLESGKMKLKARPENIVELTRQLTGAFESLANVNDIELNFAGPEELVTVYLDRKHYEKIIINLLSNALKFTPTGGMVSVHIHLSKGEIKGGMLEIYITDTGTGIPAEHLPRIFDRFYQVGDSYEKDSQGSGIGLALTKELVELHYGEIEVSSEVGKGTKFTIRFPLGKEHLKEEEILPPLKVDDSTCRGEYKGDAISNIGPQERIQEETEIPLNKKPASSEDAPILLIVEDNPDMRTYIREILAQSYQVIEGADGQEGFEKAAEIIPDIIISDVMMPEMDGFQFCEKIKTDLRTSHIPVILLTAKSSGESKVEGFETGADDYIIKPFDAKELKVRVKNLIEQRRKLRERFRQEITLEPKDIAVTSADAKFLKKVMDAVEQNIEETSFGVEELSNKVGMSRSQLFRKVKALTDQSPNEFIRTVKLKRAAVLLENRAGNISEIAYQVGFNNPAYFAECFRKLFAISPKEYVSQLKS